MTEDRPAPDVSASPREEPEKASGKFRKKPVVISAIQWTGDNLAAVIEFTDGYTPTAESVHAGRRWDDYEQLVRMQGFKVKTLEGWLNASVGDWIIRGVKGEFYPVKNDIFIETYEAVEDAAPALSTPSPASESQQITDAIEALHENGGTEVKQGLAASIRMTLRSMNATREALIKRAEKAEAELATLRAAAPASEPPQLNGSELRKGTGDVLKDLVHAERMTDTSEPGFGEVVCSGRELDFVNRALRVATGEIKNLRNTIAQHKKRPSAAPVNERPTQKTCQATLNADPPRDCNWPFCGCDAHANLVIEALEESGHLRPSAAPASESPKDAEYWRGHYDAAMANWNEALAELTTLRAAAPASEPEES